MSEIIPGLSFEEYKARPGINSSLLKIIDKQSLQHARAQLDGLCERESDALDFGHSFHELLLRGNEDFVAHPATYPAPPTHEKVKKFQICAGDPLPWNGSAGYCKEWAAKQAGKTIYGAEEASSLRAMVGAIRENADLVPYLKGQTELAVFSEVKGQQAKALIDLLPDDPAGPVIDFKKCRNAEPEAFWRDAVKLGYHLQAAFYLDVLAAAGMPRREFWFAAIEDKAPYAISISRLTEEPCSLLWVGRRHYRAALAKYAKAQESGGWDGYGIVDADQYAPGWMRQELEATA